LGIHVLVKSSAVVTICNRSTCPFAKPKKIIRPERNTPRQIIIDLLEQMKKDDASAFVDDDQQAALQSQARFTTGITHNNKPGKMTKADIMNIKDAGERQAAIASNMSLFE
jgi:hypothetical protein